MRWCVLLVLSSGSGPPEKANPCWVEFTTWLATQHLLHKLISLSHCYDLFDSMIQPEHPLRTEVTHRMYSDILTTRRAIATVVRWCARVVVLMREALFRRPEHHLRSPQNFVGVPITIGRYSSAR